MGLGKRFIILGVASLIFLVPKAKADEVIEGSAYDDYSAFESDPVQLDEEVSRYFGRFFQTDFLFGTGLFTGELGQSNGPGLDLGLRFVFYFDKLWGGELGVGYYSHSSFYNKQNTGKDGIDIGLTTVMVPVSLGVRYSFDRDNLPHGISLMNPYLAVAGEIIFRSEGVSGNPTVTGITDPAVADKFRQGAVISTTAYGANFGGGFEFDVYRNKLFLGLDLRFHVIYWPDASTLVGQLGRSGDYFTVLGQLSYNY